MKKEFTIDRSTLKDIETLSRYLKFHYPLSCRIIGDFIPEEEIYNGRTDVNICDDGELTIITQTDTSVNKDGYAIIVSEKNVNVTIKCASKRGAMYALDYLLNQAVLSDDCVYLPIMRVKDAPDFRMRGVIEGFYGLPWTQETREDLIASLRKFKMNSFWYAPKNDPYHREKWRELYEGDFLEDLLLAKKLCDNNLIDFYYCISPGLDMDVTDEGEFEKLFAKINQAINMGISSFALLLDDIDYEMKDKEKEMFYSVGEVHSFICNRLNLYLKENLGNDYYLAMCPTEYYENFTSRYKECLAKRLDENIEVIWTGYHTIAEVISEEDGITMKDVYKHNLVLWDNYPVNDFVFPRVFMGPLRNRSIRLHTTHSGMLSNPMSMWHISKIAVSTMADFMWNSAKYSDELAWEKAINESVEEELVPDLMNVARANYRSVFSCDYEREFSELLQEKGKVEQYFKELNDSADRLRQSVQAEHLIEELEPWLDKIEEEASIIDRLSSNENVEEDEIVDCLNSGIQLGITLFRDYVLKFGFIGEEVYQNRVLNDDENYYKAISTRPQYWQI